MKWTQSANEWTQALSSAEPTPGGGAAAAVCGAMGCSLLLMALRTTLKRKSTPEQNRTVLQEHVHTLENRLTQLQQLAAQDAQSYEAYLAAAKLPKQDPTRPQSLQETLWQAACVPAETARVCKEVLMQLKETENLVDKIIISDAHCARHLLHSALACCAENIRANMAYITQPERIQTLQKLLQSLL